MRKLETEGKFKFRRETCHQIPQTKGSPVGEDVRCYANSLIVALVRGYDY